MEYLEKAYYEVRFENTFLKAKGNTFQTFFNELMCRAYKNDYMPCRPWGNRGDQKNDGFLKSKRLLFQVYAPNEMTEKATIEKIDEDFEGAKVHWGNHFDNWAFVHNAHDGIPPHVQKKILDIEKANPGTQIELWGLEELREIFRQLQREDLESWFGAAPNSQTKINLGFDEIRVVLESIALKKMDVNMPVKQVPPKKIEANQLSDGIATLLKQGMEKSSLVENFFSKWYDPTFGERIAVAFREKYETIRENMTPNKIFYEFQTWVGGTERGTAEHEMAVLTIIAYYFGSCDIFEEPRGVNNDIAI
jgi:hypothetical protein